MLKNRHRFEVWQGDITTLKVDVIVNAANNALADGSGVNGAIQRAAGPELLAFCRQLHGCATGQAKLSPGFDLPARAIIHTVGPVWEGGKNKEAELLASCYRSVLKIAADEAFQSLAFPAISCGVYDYPLKEAAEIAVNTVDKALNTMPFLQKIVFCCFSDEIASVYKKYLE
jgi:O-acetyl-ADP-ribose deacetylase